MPQSEVKTKIRPDLRLEEPSLFKVLYINDDVTTMEFVIKSLMEYFEYDLEAAYKITEEIHQNGSATVALLPYEIAEQKGVEVTMEARRCGYPLQVKIESQT